MEFGDNADEKYDVDNNFLIVGLNCHITRSHNETRPDGLTWCDRMELTVVAPDKGNLVLYEWYINRSLMSGHIMLVDGPDEDLVKEILFEDALCYGLSEDYHIDGNGRRTLHISMVADDTTVDEIELKSDSICQNFQKN